MYFFVYVVVLLQMLYDAIENLEINHNKLFSHNLKYIAKRLKSEAEKVIYKLYDLNGKNPISSEAEFQFYDAKELLEMKISLIMNMNKQEKEELYTLLKRVEDRINDLNNNGRDKNHK